MRKINLWLIFTSFCLVNLSFATTVSDKTFLMPRDQVTNLAMEYTTWHNKIHRKPNAGYNGTVQVVPFYQESTNKGGIGNYFGYDWNLNKDLGSGHEGQHIKNEIGISDTDNTVLKYSYDFIHNYAGASGIGAVNTASGNIKFRPYQEVYGLRLAYHQDLDKLVDGLFFRINTPFVNVRNNMNISQVLPVTKQKLPTGDTLEGPEKDMLDYLAGHLINTDSYNKQEALKYAKITGGSKSATGFADIDIKLGYTALQDKWYRAGVNIAMLIPTGKTPKADYLFEAVHGNGHHWGIGAGFDGGVKIFSHDNKSIEFMLVADYKYIFEGTEKRTLDFKRVNDRIPSAGYYNLGGKNGVQGVFPLANVLTQDIKVTPGSQIDLLAGFAFNLGRFTFDVGYELFAKETERVHLKNPWLNDLYAEASWQYGTGYDFNIYTNSGVLLDVDGFPTSFAYNGAPDGTNAAINRDYLDFDTIKGPSQTTHKVYAGLGYQFEKCKYPIMLGLGGSFEYSARNSALQGYAIWAKTGLSW